jgi:hypothetical protein
MDVAPLEAADLIGKFDPQELVSTLHGWLLMIVREWVNSSMARSFFSRCGQTASGVSRHLRKSAL